MTDIKIKRLINLHDKTLNEMRAKWEAETNPDVKKTLMEQIDSALDYRFELMAERDLANGVAKG